MLIRSPSPTDSGMHAVDTGFIVFNDRNSPGFKRLLSELDVPTQPSTMSFGVSDGCGFEYNGASPNGLFARRRHLVSPAFHGMIADLVRFNRNARRLLGSDADPSLGEWLADGGYGAMFVDRLITPQVFGRVVVRSSVAVVISGPVPGRVLRQPRDAWLSAPTAVADGAGRVPLWRLYLAYCEAGFDEGRIGVVQMLLAKPRWRSSLVGGQELTRCANM